MTRVRVHNISVSLDGFAAGPNQGADAPLGEGGGRLHEWAFATKTYRTMFGEEGGSTGVDESYAAAGDVGVGATIMGRNMFGPLRGEWTDEEWKGWWGPNPPYHHPVFVLTHFARPSIEMEGGTTFHFVTDGIESALEQATKAADGADIRLGGGVATIQEYLRAGLIDELHFVVVPVLLGSGERLLDNVGDALKAYDCELQSSDAATHYRFTRK
ncbi:dihydrofolate reductase family protein [Antrihabitans stalactiti]|uniref:Dihydrofolate reductase n=1 Tax=Antrihabitans stalactiti TaxID=2584121 RepID=A0A848KBP2_9NOCA|nr:dihydrofolate reductase family protein [Antrihabitans stalactiti]NMN95731.1 dihydrofolate reductase [Antrihabitans stalactiti]